MIKSINKIVCRLVKYQYKYFKNHKSQHNVKEITVTLIELSAYSGMAEGKITG